jgi:RND superfamily putative drug exporter
MIGRLAELALHRRRLVFIATGIFFIASLLLGSGVVQHLQGGDVSADGAESAQANKILRDDFGTGPPNYVLLVSTRSGHTVDDPAIAIEGRALTAKLAAQPGVLEASSYWTLGSPTALRNAGSDRALILARIAGNDDSIYRAAKRLTPLFATKSADVTVEPSGRAEIVRVVNEVNQQDLSKAEVIALPITFLLLLFVFGTVASAAMPIAIGALTVVGTFLLLRILATVTDVSIFAVNFTTALGFGLAIDYSLLMVSRFREELGQGADPDDALRRTVETAGRTVIASAFTVGAALLTLVVFPFSFLRSFAYAGIAVAALAGICAIVVLPALLGALGSRVDRLAIRRTQRLGDESRFWRKVARAVMRRPLLVAIAAGLVLILLGAPLLHIRLGLPDDRVLPPGNDSRRVADVLRKEFSGEEFAALTIVAADAGPRPNRASAVNHYASRLSLLPGVARVDAELGSYVAGRRVIEATPANRRFGATSGTWLSVVPTVEPYSPAGEALVHKVRATTAPFDVKVSGESAVLVDTKDALIRYLPLALALMAFATVVVLWLMFGSILIPLKALILNVLSMSAVFGPLVWIFQEGHGSGILDFTATGTLSATIAVLIFCIAFGLSMDYEVFLLSRIQEEYLQSGDNEAAVARGLARCGRIVTAAAVLISVVFLATMTSQIRDIKLFGLGMAAAVILDAFVVRATILPAVMKLAGRANWWSPPALRRLHARLERKRALPPAVTVPPT